MIKISTETASFIILKFVVIQLASLFIKNNLLNQYIFGMQYKYYFNATGYRIGLNQNSLNCS